MPKPKIAIIGPGRVGCAVARLLKEKRFPIAAVAGPSSERVHRAVEFIGAGKPARSAPAAAKTADVVLLTTPDRMIKPVCDEIAAAKGFKRNATVLHCSGAHDAELLASARACKARVAVLHPLQSFASPEQAVRRMKGTYFTFDGDDDAEPVAAQIVQALGGTLVRVRPKDRALYHAASCVLSNYLVALADLSFILMQLSGLSPKDAARALQPLMRGTVENIDTLGVPHALTGPIARGDVETVQRHLDALRPLPRDIRRLYTDLGLYTVRIAQRKGTLKSHDALALTRLLTEGA
jgi:predicted short-subunit dehydrogenase-like oxidoreductase (DUF2520 family)